MAGVKEVGVSWEQDLDAHGFPTSAPVYRVKEMSTDGRKRLTDRVVTPAEYAEVCKRLGVDGMPGAKWGGAS